MEVEIPTVEILVKEITGEVQSIAVSADIGQGSNAQGIVLGKELCLG